MNYELKELGLGGLLDYTFRIYKDNFKFVATIMLLLVFPTSLVLDMGEVFQSQSEGTEVALDTASNIQKAKKSKVVVPLILIFFQVFAEGALCYGVAQFYIGSTTTAAKSLGFAFRRTGTLILLFLLGLLGISFGMMFLIIPGIFLMMQWYVAIPALMFENLSPSAALARSKALTNGLKGTVFTLTVLLGLISIAALTILELIPQPHLQAIVVSAMVALLAGLRAVASTVFYFSARCKHENYDLELLSQSLGASQKHVTPELK